MRKLVVNEFLSLDGVAQAPGEPDEDPSGGFAHGGWHIPYMDEAAMKWVVENVANAEAFLFGRRTYEIFAAHWPNASEEEQVLAQPLNTKPKHVVSTTLTEPLEWENATLVKGDVADAVPPLKEGGDGELFVIGSLQLVQSLLEHDLVDELRVMIDPLVLGGGKRLFGDDGNARPLRLVDSQVTSTGSFLATYAPGR